QIDDALGQVTNVTKEASYNGVNLVAGVDADLEVYLSEDRTSSSSSITVKSVDATLTGLGLNALDIIWDTDLATSLGKIDTALSAVDAAISKVSSYTSTFSNTYSSIENWENFTSNLVNTLTEGAEKLTLADMNEESANYIALQTRQSLATSALSLASQASQSVLGFF
ncbi:MAG: flagellin, partial [Alphaproteobacteria bacterium]